MLSSNFLLECKDALKPFGELDVLGYYSVVAGELQGFLKGKMLASKVWLPNGMQLLKRGSKLEPLYIEELMQEVDEKFLQLRVGKHLKEARGKISKKQEKLWQYFYPRKLSDFFYATNNESPGLKIERIFFDIDKSSETSENARKVASALIKLIERDKEFEAKMPSFKVFPMWTGSSFHVYLLLKEKITVQEYDKLIQFSKNNPLASFTGKWCKAINENTNFKVVGGHEKEKGKINIDPSQTPSGKLARSPFSLHLKNARETDGIALPLKAEMLEDKNLIQKLQKHNAKKVLQELEEFGKKF